MTLLIGVLSGPCGLLLGFIIGCAAAAAQAKGEIKEQYLEFEKTVGKISKAYDDSIEEIKRRCDAK